MLKSLGCSTTGSGGSTVDAAADNSIASAAEMSFPRVAELFRCI